MNLTERAEIRKETFYKLTNSADVPEAPSGNRNLALGTSGDWSNGLTSFSGINNQTVVIYKIYNKGLKVGDKINVRIDIKYSDIVAVEGKTARMALQSEGNVTHWDSGSLGVGGAVVPNGEDDEVVLTAVTSVTENHLKNDYWNWRLRVDYVTSGKIQWKEAKAEISETATPYSQAPEDLGWSSTALVPTQAQRYLWKFEYIYYSDGSVEVTSPINISIAGADGTNGQTSHVHFAFADNATGGGFSLTTPKAYMGWYADFNESASNDPTKYKWGKWKGDQGVAGQKGDDGKTSYLHLAYASSADGKTGFSFTDTKQQYQGYYTDFTQTSSTDPTKYTWMDRRAGIEVGSKNLLRKTAVNTENLKLFGTTDTTVSVVEKDGHQVYKLVVSGSSNAGAYFIGNSNYYNLVKDRNYTFSFWVLTNKDKNFNVNSLGHIQAVNNNSDKVGNDNLHQHSEPVYSTNTIKANTWTKVWLTFKPTSNSYFKPYFWYLRADDEIYIYDMMLNEGTVPLSHSLAPEDTQEQIDSKADQVLTQEQLNALAEKNRNMEAELAAKASLETIEQWKQAYDAYVAQNDRDKSNQEQNLVTLSTRLAEWVKDWEDKKVQWSFLDTNMDFGEEGLRLGKKGSPTSIMISNDRISFFSGGSEVASMSNGTLTIDNGIFAKSLQIGHYREEVYEGDKNINVIRWVD